MTFEAKAHGAVEVFSIDTVDFKLSAMMLTTKDGGSLVRGWTKFKDGEKYRFSSKDTDKQKLRNRVMRACIPIATFYGAELVHEKIGQSGDCKPVCVSPKSAAFTLH